MAGLRFGKTKGRPACALPLGLLVLGLATVIPVLGALAAAGAIVFGSGALALRGWRTYRSGSMAQSAVPAETAPASPLA